MVCLFHPITEGTFYLYIVNGKYAKNSNMLTFIYKKQKKSDDTGENMFLFMNFRSSPLQRINKPVVIILGWLSYFALLTRCLFKYMSMNIQRHFEQS